MTTRILHVTQPVDAGVAVLLADLAEHQVSLGWEVHVASPPVGWLVQRLAGTPVHVHAWDARRSPGRSTLTEVRDLRRLVRDVGPDLVHLHSAKAGLAGRLAIRGRVPTVFQPHAWSFHAAGGLLQQLSTRWEQRAVRWTDLLIAVSQGELDEGVRAGIQARHSVVVSNGVAVDHFVPRDRAQARERLGLGDAPLAVCVGRLARQKGQDLAFEAWEIVRATVPGAQLAVVGDGPDRADLARALPPGATLHGAVEDPRDWYAAADLVVLPSRWEGMALVPLEAMASGRSVVGFDVAGVSESLGDAGMTVPAGDLHQFGKAVAERLSDPEQAAAEGERGRRRAVELFDRRRTIVETSAAAARLAQAPSRGGSREGRWAHHGGDGSPFSRPSRP